MANKKVIQIGAGGFGQSWLEAVKACPDAELCAVVELSEANLKKAGEITGLPEERLFTDLKEAFKTVQADIALIVTPQQTHKALTLQAVRAGMHVLMEKPMTDSYANSIELLNESKQYDKRVMVSQNYRYFASIQTLKRMLEQAVVGKIGYVEYTFRQSIQLSGWRDTLPEVLLEDMSIHHFDLLRYLLGKEAIEIFAQSFQTEWSWWKGKPAASVVIQFEDGIHVNYFGSWVPRGSLTPWSGDIRLVGERGELVLAGDQIVVREVNTGGEVTQEREIPLAPLAADPRVLSLSELISAIREDRRPLTSIEDNIYSFELTCAAVESVSTGKKIRLSEYRHHYHSE
ncbi:Gfo/Idh/MocA family protein [Paenibacillus senegalensis]|uniref:Gfo/Idh/MocA family protein n=1 Tax=Paenibacillus senegalensis TaxID=1465766 RepID=UPI000287DAB3|nr:Gfo/Idh/MocA family oxidoreductase [Paenibacillus senegalensis]